MERLVICLVCWLLGCVQQSELEISASERIFSSNSACRYALLILYR